VDWPTSLLEAAEALPSFPPVPVTVITATHSFTDPCDEQLPCDELQALWLEAQDKFAATLTPDARHVLADTGHYAHEDDPDLVETEISALLALIKPLSEADDGRWRIDPLPWVSVTTTGRWEAKSEGAQWPTSRPGGRGKGASLGAHLSAYARVYDEPVMPQVAGASRHATEVGTGAEIRTRTPLRAAEFKSAASTSSATPAGPTS
jgi:hypothetical protein